MLHTTKKCFSRCKNVEALETNLMKVKRHFYKHHLKTGGKLIQFKGLEAI